MTNQTIKVSGMTCEACAYKIKYLFGQLPSVSNVTVELSSGEVYVSSSETISITAFTDALQKYPNYQVVTKLPSAFGTFLATYKPVLIILGLIVLVAVITAIRQNETTWFRAVLHYFMTGFFLVFAGFKLLDIRGFVGSFRRYDLLAARSEAYAWAYPFIELCLGLLCLAHLAIPFVYWADILLMGFGLLGVIASIYRKETIACACLGSIWNLPMSTVAIIENSLMVLAGIALLVV